MNPREERPLSQLHESDLAAAVVLGWRVAELYSRVDDLGDSASDTLLPAHASLPPADQLELQLRAAAGDAKRAGVTSKSASLEDLVPLARDTAEGDDPDCAFRGQLRACHIEINKDLWAMSEALGKAYELGNGLSDTYGLICRAYRAGSAEHRAEAWRHVFAVGRIERLKKLLDDLQSRLDAMAVTVVREQLDAWRAQVEARLDPKSPPAIDAVREHLRRQTIIWRQLVAGDKRADAYLGAEERGRVRDRMRKLAWKRYRAWALPLVPALAGFIFVLPGAIEWYQKSVIQSGVASLVVAAIGALGITRASLVMTVRTRLHEWAELLWHQAIVSEVARTTLTAADAFSTERDASRIAAAAAYATSRLRAVAASAPAPEGQTR
jgi:hypothetical protein